MKLNRESFFNIYLPIIIFLIAFCWKLVFINSRDICIDEPFTIFHAQEGVWDILKLPANNEPNPPLFMLLLHFWIKLFGNSAASVRLLPLLFNALTAVIIYFTGKKFFNTGSGVLASSLFILSTYHFYFGLETRTYSLLSMATAGSLFFYLSLLRNPDNKKHIAALVFTNFLLIYSHFFGWFVVFIQFVANFLYLKDRKVFKTVLITTVLTGVTFLPMAPIFIKQFFISSKGTWVQPPESFEFLNQLYFFSNSRFMLNIFTTIIIFGIILMVLFKNFKTVKKEFFVILLWWLVPYTIMFFVSYKVPMFISRYILFNSIGYYLFLGVFINIFFKEIYAYILSGVVVVLMFYYLEINSKFLFYREVQNSVNHIKKYVNESTSIIIYPHWDHYGFIYYYNNEIFRNTSQFDSLLEKNCIYPSWHLDYLKSTVSENLKNRVILFQVGSDDKSIFKYLDTTYKRVDSTFFPQCFVVGVFDVKNQ